MPAMTNETVIAGPASSAAAWPVSTKMPAPIITPIPKTMTSKIFSSRLSRNPCSSVPATLASIVFRRASEPAAIDETLTQPGARWRLVRSARRARVVEQTTAFQGHR